MNGYDYKLKEQQVNNLANLSSIAGSLDDMRAGLAVTSSENIKRVDNALGEVCMSIDALTSQMVILNKIIIKIANKDKPNK